MNDQILKQIADNLTRQTELLTALKDRDNPDMHEKHDVSNLTHTGIKLHGDTGLFSTPGLDRDVITAHVRPHGLAGMLPLLPSIDEDPRYAILTGFTGDTGDEATNACDPAPTGFMKACTLTARFGMIRKDTNTIEMDKVMLRVNRGDFTDLALHGRVLGLTNIEPGAMPVGQILNVITAAEMVSVGVRTERTLSRQIWQGSRAVANEFPGLDAQIATGQVDAETNVACPAVDSDVKDYNLQDIDTDIVTYLSQLEVYLRYNAMTMGLDPVNWVIVMRPDLWFELTAVWPCAYHTNRCSPVVDQNASVMIDGRENTAERDAMRNGMYLIINGNRYPVVVDTGIFEHNANNNAGLIPGEYASSIYMVPLTITGNFPVCYREYVDYRRATPDVALLRNANSFFWTDNGVYAWFYLEKRFCYELGLKTEQRVILRTPHLAGRVDNVKYSPLQHLRDPDPDSPYHSDGGQLYRYPGIATPNAVWQS